MHILISNDDGFLAEGIKTLAAHLAKIAKVTIVAPDLNRSGASSSLSLDTPLSVKEAEPDYYYVNGTPTDCVHIALSGLLSDMPDFVISGINDGANMGDDTVYSGTVAAAKEGYLVGIPSFAISMSQHKATHFETAAKVTVELVERFVKNPIKAPPLLNVNVPDIPYEQLQGTIITRLGKRHKAEPPIETKTPRGDTVYWIGPAGQPKDNSQGTDFHAVENNQVSITPLGVDLTQYEQISALENWIK